MSRYDNFSDSDPILLQSNSSGNSYNFIYAAATSSTAKGNLPFETQMTSVYVSGYNEAGDNVTSTLVGSWTLFPQDEKVVVRLNWPGSTGRYKLTFLLTLNDSSKHERDYAKIEAVNL